MHIGTFNVYTGLAACLFPLWLGFLLWSPTTRRQLLRATAVGAIGGPTISLFYRPDFWNPPTAWGWYDGPQVYLAIEDVAFGALFLSIFMAIFPLVMSWLRQRLVPLRACRLSRSDRIRMPALWTIAFFGCLSLDIDPVVATTIALGLSVILMLYVRAELAKAALVGTVVSVGAYVVLVGGYLLVMQLTGIADINALGREWSQYYVKYGPTKTAAVLACWSAAFGAFFGVAPAYFRNQYYDSLP